MPRGATQSSAANAHRFELTEIPRRKTSGGGEGGPYVLLPGATRSWGEKPCETCGRKVEPNKRFPRKGNCKCFYYQRTTTFIDVLQDEFLLKQWGNRNVAYGMGQRADLVLAAASCKPDSDDLQTLEDKRHLNEIVSTAMEVAGSKAKAQIGTSLHKLTHQMDRGDTLGVVPDPYPADLKAYDECVKAEGIEWVDIESFRVYDDWISKSCKHIHPKNKTFDPENPCRCTGVAGTVDRIGWYKGRLRIFDIKTGSNFNKIGHAMQLAMYARMRPYSIPLDERQTDLAPIDLNVGYIIELPAGEGHCELVPYDLARGWGAVSVAKQVWGIRKDADNFRMNNDKIRESASYFDIAARASSKLELNMIWKSAKESCSLTADLKAFIKERGKELPERLNA